MLECGLRIDTTREQKTGMPFCTSHMSGFASQRQGISAGGSRGTVTASCLPALLCSDRLADMGCECGGCLCDTLRLGDHNGPLLREHGNVLLQLGQLLLVPLLPARPHK